MAVRVFPRWYRHRRTKDGAREYPFACGSQIAADAGPRGDAAIARKDRRGGERLYPRYHPSCTSGTGIPVVHLSAVVTMGATHPGLLDRTCHAGQMLVFLRPAAPGRVPEFCTIPGLAPSPGRFGARILYFSPSSRVVVRLECVNQTETDLQQALTDGDRQRVVRRRRTEGRRRGERESNSCSTPGCVCCVT